MCVTLVLLCARRVRDMARVIAVAVVVCVLGLVRRVGGNGMPRPKLWSILDAEGEWHVHASQGGALEVVGSMEAEKGDGADVKIWPMPVSVSHGDGTVMMNRGSFRFEYVANGSAMLTLAKAFVRYYDVIFSQHAQSWNSSPSRDALRKLVVTLGSEDEELQYGVDESYTLSVPDSPGVISLLPLKRHPYRLYLKRGVNVLRARRTTYSLNDQLTSASPWQAPTVYGALRGLETFSQLTTFSFNAKTVQINRTPYVIKDFPRFAYRGLLIDTSRHYQPVSSIKRVLDSMAYSKLNVLHWHIVDEQSFPIDIPSYPLLWKGAYSSAERYTMDDAREIVEYARLRGIHVMPELDVPGHAASWGVGYPDLWPASECIEPLDVSKNFTFDVINGIIGDFSSVFPFKFAHLGGDEVDTSCWEQTSHIKSWLNNKNITTKDAYADFIVRAQEIAIQHGYEPVNWEETFYAFASKLKKETVVHNWLQGGTCPKAVKKGFRCIHSDQATWYLDHLDASWDIVYDTEPLLNITNPGEQSLVIGGEVCMWGETVDESNILQTIWPRAAAAAERLWSSLAFTKQGATPALKRFQDFRCLLNRRGISAAPVFWGSSYAFGRDSPRDPGSCLKQ